VKPFFLASIFYSYCKDGGIKLLRNVGKNLPVDRTSYPRRLIFIHTTSDRLFQTYTVRACISFKETLRRRWPDILEVPMGRFLSL